MVFTRALIRSHFAPWIRLVSPTGVLLGNSFTQTGASNIAATAPTSGTYTVIIGSYLGGFYDGTGSYLLTLAQGPGAVEVSTGDEGRSEEHTSAHQSRSHLVCRHPLEIKDTQG